jgi:hypothetical protein
MTPGGRSCIEITEELQKREHDIVKLMIMTQNSKKCHTYLQRNTSKTPTWIIFRLIFVEQPELIIKNAYKC